ncbi:hypothetical protein E2320_007169 [Naja naja]|nr:hypothetical protein E2320_007169 [Naja naja]
MAPISVLCLKVGTSDSLGLGSCLEKLIASKDKVLEDTPMKVKSQVQRSLWEEEEVGGRPWKNEKEGKMKIRRNMRRKEGEWEEQKMGGRERRRDEKKEERKDPILDETILKNSYSICTSFDAL